MLVDRLKIMAEHVADWLDDRWTWTAIGLLTGYFGFGSADSMEWKAWQEMGIAVASLVLILVRDQKRSPVEPQQKAGWNDASEIPPIDLVGKSESGTASPAEHADFRDSILARRGDDPVADSVQRVSSRARSNTAEAMDRNPHGFGDRD